MSDVPKLMLEYDYKFFEKLLNRVDCEDFDENIAEDRNYIESKEEIEDFRVGNIQIKGDREENEDNDVYIKEQAEISEEENDIHIKDEIEIGEETYLPIKVEEQDTLHEKKYKVNVESKVLPADDTHLNSMILKKIFEREVRIVLDRIDIGTLRKQHKLSEVTHTVKPEENTENRKFVTDSILRTLLSSNFKTRDINFSKYVYSESNLEIPIRKQNIDSKVSGFQVNKVSEQVNSAVLTNKVEAQNLILQNKKTLPSEVIIVNRENKIFKQSARTSLDVSNKRKKLKSNIRGSKNVFSCHICDYKCNFKGNLKRHLRIHTGEKPFICDICNYSCSMKAHLSNHMQCKHTKVMNFSCNMCQYKCVTKSLLERHLQKHTGEKPYECDLCDYRGSCMTLLKTHIQNRHLKEKKFSCHMCQCKFYTKCKLNIHLRKHGNLFYCDACEYKCIAKNDLKRHRKHEHTEDKHLKTHLNSPEKSHKCELCDYRCSVKRYLKRHMQYIHTKEKNYSCHLCEYKCVEKNALNVHLRKHTLNSPEKSHKCELCDYRCTGKRYLKRHMQYIHTKEKNYSCHLCEYKCVEKTALNVHLRKHTGEKPYSCQLCVYRGSRISHLKRHMKTVHEI